LNVRFALPKANGTSGTNRLLSKITFIDVLSFARASIETAPEAACWWISLRQRWRS